MKIQNFEATISLILSIAISHAKAQALLDFETGMVTTGYNNVSIPGDLCTLFFIKRRPYPKVELFYRTGQKMCFCYTL